MGKYAQPCILCGQELENVDWNESLGSSASENQPYAGTSFTSGGHYGSTCWDPFDGGSYLSVNFCDPCLLKLRAEGKINVGQSRRPVNVDGWGICGFERISRPELVWSEETAGNYNEEDVVNVDLDEALTLIDNDQIQWTISPNLLKKEFDETGLTAEDRLRAAAKKIREGKSNVV